MRLKHQISFNNIPQLERSISKMDFAYKLIEGLVGRLVNLIIYDDDTRWSRVQELLATYKVDYITATEFEKADFKMAEWFLVQARETGYPEPHENFEFRKITYDLQRYCFECGVERIQKSNFLINGMPKLKVDIFCLNWIFDELFVREPVNQVVKESAIRGVTFDIVIHSKTKRTLEGISQLKVDYILKAGLDSYNCNIEKCRDHKTGATEIKYNYPYKGGVTLDKSIFPKEIDIAKTNEWFGSGHEAHRLILCSRKFYDLAIKEKWKGLKFSPVFHNRVAF